MAVALAPSRAAFLRLRPMAALILGLGVPGFIALAWLVSLQGHQNVLDVQATAWALQSRSPGLTQAWLVITHLHSVAAISAYTVGLSLWLMATKAHRHWLLPLWLFVPGGALLNVLMKHGFERPRPLMEEALLRLHTFSFPSGHASGTTLLYGFLALVVLVHERKPWWRWLTAAVALLVIGLVCWSRVYLGVHFLTDVLAGVLEALVWMALCVIALSARRRPAG